MTNFSTLRRHVAVAVMACSHAAGVVLATFRISLRMTLSTADVWQLRVKFVSCSSTRRRLYYVVFAFIGLWLPVRDAEATIIRFQTTLGNIDIRLYDTATPIHTANILNYINSNRYDGTFIHRSAKLKNGEDFVIQGGGYKILTSVFDSPIESGWTRIPNFGTVTNEPGISNRRGTLALAKGSGVNSGTSEWFINLNDENVFLDEPAPVSNQFTVFGRLIRNTITVADAIAALNRVNAVIYSEDTPIYNVAFGEVPVLDIDTVLGNQDIFNSDVVLMNDAVVLNYPKGDYNFDGTVNIADYNIWKTDFGSTTKAEADGDGDGVVNTADYTIWRDSFGRTTIPGGGLGASAAAGVPEPSPLLLALLAGGALVQYVRRRHIMPA